jgi:probable HAF family extracellular repeat protein
MTDLGALSTDSWGTAINDLGQVVGYANVASPALQHAFLWSAGHMIDLGSPYGPAYESLALGINNAGQVVGWYSSGNERAFLYSGGQMFDLDSPTGTFFQGAYGINDSGEIAARGADNHIYLLTPVPEPTAGALVLLVLALGLRSRCQRKSRTTVSPVF